MRSCPACKLSYSSERTFCSRCGAALEELRDARIGSTLAGRYVLEEIIGQGGMATVYRARHALVDRTCAVKVVSPMLARDVTVRERFRREAKSVQKIAHPNVVDVQDQGVTEDGTSYIVMEYLEGASLAALLAKGRVEINRALGLMIQLARGIARAHDLDVVHRDLKPENVFIAQREDGSDLVKVLDFGIARSLHDPRLTEQGELFGTPQYMAPERIANADSGPPTDLYALGVMFYELVVGELPFDARDITTFFVKHLKDPPPDPRKLAPDVPDALADLILRLLAKEPKARPVDAHRVYMDLVEIARSRKVPIPPDPLADPASSRPAVSSRVPEAAKKWRKRMKALERVIDRGYGENNEEPYRKLGEMRGKIARLAELDQGRSEVQSRAEKLMAMGHEGRQRFGGAVDALGVDASRAREDERSAREAAAESKKVADEARKAYLAANKDVSRWEGRSAFTEPYADLSAAYRAAADAMDAWLEAKQAERRSTKEADAKARAVSDLEFQIKELRGALAAHEKTMESQEDTLATDIERLGKEADALERDLTKLAEALMQPLRGKPDFAPILREVEAS